jgi:phosphohistidine phosphatase
MSKTLYIVRHAKSSWDDPFLPDHERPLAPKGVKKTLKIAGFLKSNISCPELFLSSTAVRAKQTAGILASELGYPEGKIKYTKNLYHAGEDDIFNELYSLPDNIHSVMIFGHNPGFTYFVNLFLNPTIDNLPTSGTVSISFSTEKWHKINSAKFHVNFVVFPKMLK